MTNPKKDGDNTSKPNTAPAGKQNVREPATPPPTPLTFFSGQGPAAQTPTAAELGLLPPSSAPTTTQPAPAPAHDGAALSTVDTPAAPDTATATAPGSGTAVPAVAPSPVTTPVRRQPSRRNASQQDVAAADSSPSKGKKGAAKPDKNAPREDALQAGQDAAHTQLVDHTRRIDALDRELTAGMARSKAQHSATTKTVADLTKRTVETETKLDAVGAGLDDIAASFEGLANEWETLKDRIAHDQRDGGAGGTSLAAGMSDIQNQLDALQANFLDATETLASLQYAMHESSRLDADRDNTLQTALNMASAAMDTVNELKRALARSERRDQPSSSRSDAHTERRSSRRHDRPESDSEATADRAPKVPRHSGVGDVAGSRGAEHPLQSYVSYPIGSARTESRDEYYRAGTRPPSAIDPTPPTEPAVPCPEGACFIRLGASRTVTTIAFGRRNESHVALSLVSQWAATIDPTGGIPAPIRVHCPPGLADNFRIFEFNSHADLVTFVNAWQRRPDALQPVIATPISDPTAAAATTQSGPALGLLPPSGPSSGSSARRPSGPANKDPNGRRPF
ncbi:hypothetical protein EXIGLDRAFT_705003 [Exidia glandulosa HHB12029]|uniref:Uncharacterized protein n=1 Tax=Exidia glandulosa HHB12029 TaxID=1314781 RepID=A0A165Z9G3_EXIGL|nr:hypothetical protein EXIGLDRAFT_705003 [Exidia glandulosa HHB12029]